ncbi:MAG: choice-of-anchor Q domain-containing protein [Myxococcaceae bacterium]
MPGVRLTFFVVCCVGCAANATEYFVAPGGAGDGSSGSPFGTIAQGVNAAQAGDTVNLAAGTYSEAIATVRAGTAGAPIVLRAAPGAAVSVTALGRVLTISHGYFEVDGLSLDGQYGANDIVRITSAGNGTVLRNIEVRRSGNDCIDMGAPSDVRIENALIHHCLNATGGRTDAHGVVGGAVTNLTILDSEIHTFSGDALQFDPGRASPGWDDILIEGCEFWLKPLTTPENGFAEGVVPGENGIDTKTYDAKPTRSKMLVRDTVAHGFRDALISNAAAFNVKENAQVAFENVTVYDSEIAFRVRGPGGGPGSVGAWVDVKNSVIHHVATAFRYEDNVAHLQVYNTTLGQGVTQMFLSASSASGGLDVRNVLFLGGTRPAEAAASSNLPTTEASFVSPNDDDYHLKEGAPAINAGESLAAVSDDKDGNPRPLGGAHDVGAYEWVAPIGDPPGGPVGPGGVATDRVQVRGQSCAGLGGAGLLLFFSVLARRRYSEDYKRLRKL